MKISFPATLATIAGLTVGVVATGADAAIVGDAFVITATNTNGTDSFVIPASSLTWTGSSWLFETSGGWSQAMSNGVTINSISTEYVEDPMIFFNFGVSTGGVATNISVSSATLVFPTLLNPIAYASSGMTLTDNNSGGSASVVANLSGFSYNAIYNNTSLYSAQQPSFGVGVSNGTQTQNANDLGNVVPGLVGNMQAAWNFQLSADDSVGVTSTWVLVPAPGTLAMIGLGGLAMTRRRR